jgi:hypothetical protein
MSGINSGHHNLPTYQMTLKSDNVEYLRYCGGPFENSKLKFRTLMLITSKCINDRDIRFDIVIGHH